MTQPEIIVIGGGIAGTSAAAHLAEHADVLLLEAEPHLGYHSTGRSAAIFIRNYGNEVLRALNAASAPVLQSGAGISDTGLLSPRGELLIASEEDIPELESYAREATGLEHLRPDQAVELVPILRKERIAAAILEPDAQDIDVDRMLQGYVRLLRSRGGKTVTGSRVRGLSRNKGVWQVTTEEGDYSASLIVNAGGAWADQIGELAGAHSVGLTPMRRSAVLLDAPKDYDIEHWPLFASVTESWYAKPDAGKLLVSPADEDPTHPHDAWPDDMVLAEGLYRYEQAVTVPVTRPSHSWAGLRSFTPDRTPVVGFDPAQEGFFWLAGQGGYGVQTAPALAALCAALCRGRAPELNTATVEALSPARFARG
ncbi:NAD(P)/FAD-dependent oxidoreductase [Neptunicoccus cionae]|uniref:Glycerol-3-phosphate dehydrogenase n=1 Tax=Neptunicoccus cionae TaxID=2035344 RepID=A0A916VSV3_9RHOB|nr:FAD-binding oxidoreductase [Amylibacter cionae]GGA28291.1 glycerol-3-phosphate dehydrogenase [Amylibacter cionae]